MSEPSASTCPPGILMQRGHERWLDQNGILLWRARLWAHQPRGTVSAECTAWTGQVRLNTLQCFTFTDGVQRSDGLLVFACQVFNAGIGLDRLGVVRLVGLGPAPSSSGCQNCCSDPHRGHHLSRASRWQTLAPAVFYLHIYYQPFFTDNQQM